MNDIVPPDAIAAALAEVWSHQEQGDFGAYIAETCQWPVCGPVVFDCIYIAQAQGGDVATNVLEGSVRWWKVDDEGCRAAFPTMKHLNEVRFDLCVAPLIRFLNQGRNILIGEVYGPKLLCRKVGTLSWQGSRIVLADLRVITTFNSYGLGHVISGPNAGRQDCQHDRGR